MKKQVWILAALVTAAAPVACVVNFGGPGGQGGFGASGPGGSGAGGGSGGHGTNADQCNPVTAAGCPSDGSTCDLGQSGFFQCFPPPNTVDVCGACDDATMFCGSDLTCVLPNDSNAGVCFRYCCTDADCGAGGTCDTSFGQLVLSPADKGDAVGLCVTSTVDDEPACGPPAASPSAGSCVAGFSGGTGGGSPGTGGGSPGTGGGSPGTGGGSPGDGGPPHEDGGGEFSDGGHGGRHDGGAGHGG